MRVTQKAWAKEVVDYDLGRMNGFSAFRGHNIGVERRFLFPGFEDWIGKLLLFEEWQQGGQPAVAGGSFGFGGAGLMADRLAGTERERFSGVVVIHHREREML